MSEKIVQEEPIDEGMEPSETLQIDDPDALKLLADPFRSRILDLLRAKVHTAKELAQTLNLSPKKLYYHLKLMEEKGLIRVVGTRIVSGIIEKSYRATSYLFLFGGDLFCSNSADGSTLPPGMQAVFESTRTQLEVSFADGLIELKEDAPIARRMMWMWGMQRLPIARAEEFYAKLEALLREFEADERRDVASDYQDFRLFITMFPVKAFLKTPPHEPK